MDENIKAFLRVLDPSDNSTGGGTASAVAGAMAAALVSMVARLSVGKSGMAPEAYYQEITTHAEKLATRLFDGSRRDAEAFDAVMTAIRKPKETEDQMAVRKSSIASAMLQATEIPLANAEGCQQALDLCSRLQDRSNPNAVSDLESARHLALAGLKGCLANVAINLPSLKDQAGAEQIKARAQELQQFVNSL